jgi:hypothetical protein
LLFGLFALDLLTRATPTVWLHCKAATLPPPRRAGVMSVRSGALLILRLWLAGAGGVGAGVVRVRRHAAGLLRRRGTAPSIAAANAAVQRAAKLSCRYAPLLEWLCARSFGGDQGWC